MSVGAPPWRFLLTNVYEGTYPPEMTFRLTDGTLVLWAIFDDFGLFGRLVLDRPYAVGPTRVH